MRAFTSIVGDLGPSLEIWRTALHSAGIGRDLKRPAKHEAVSSLLLSIVVCPKVESVVSILVAPDFWLDNGCR